MLKNLKILIFACDAVVEKFLTTLAVCSTKNLYFCQLS